MSDKNINSYSTTVVANDAIESGELVVTVSNKRHISPFEFEFTSDSGGKKSFSMSRNAAQKVAICIIRNL